MQASWRKALGCLAAATTLGVATGCGSTPSSGCEDCRTITAFDSTRQCSVAIPGYYYIASPLPYSGAWPVGEQVEHGIRQAVTEINAAGGVKGRRLGLVLCETASDPAQASAILQNVADVPEISATTCCMRSAETIPASAIGRDRRIVMLSPGATSTAITGLSDDGFTNRTVPPDSVQGAIAAAVAYESGARTAFVATLDDPYGTSLADVFISAFETAGGATMQMRYAEAGELYTPALTEIVAAATAYDPDLVYVAGLSRDGGTLVNVASDTGYVVPWMLPDGGRTADFITAVTDQSYLANVTGTAPAPPSSTFAAAFRANWGEDPEVFVAAAYDAIYLLAISMELATDPDDRVAIRDNLLMRTQTGNAVSVETAGWEGIVAELASAGTIDYEGVSGPVDLDANGDVAADVELWNIRGGAFQTVGCRTPENLPCE